MVVVIQQKNPVEVKLFFSIGFWKGIQLKILSKTEDAQCKKQQQHGNNNLKL